MTEPARVICGDMRVVLATLPPESVHAIVTDPPYGLAFMGKAWDQQVPGPEYWRECLRVAKPGAHLIAFGGTRTAHRLACAIEDAGWEIRDCLSWLYGSGFPKSHNLDGEWDGWGTALKPAWEPGYIARKPFRGSVASCVCEHRCGALNIDGCRIGSPESKQPPCSRSYGAGKLAGGLDRDGVLQRVEHDGLGRWPANLALDEAAAAMLDAQTGELHGAGCARTGPANPRAKEHEPSSYRGSLRTDHMHRFGDSGGASRFFYVSKASRSEREAGLAHHSFLHVRWQWEGVDQQARLRVDTAQSRPKVIAASGAPNSDATAWSTMLFGSESEESSLRACRSTIATATSSTTQSQTLSWLRRSLTSESTADASSAMESGSNHADSAASLIVSIGTTGVGTVSLPGVGSVASGTLLTISESGGVTVSDGRATAADNAYQRGSTVRKCDHPTVKPVSLMRWLVRLITPPGGTVLDPFTGSGSTGVAAVLEGACFIGCELSPEYAELARARIAHAADEDDGPQLTLFERAELKSPPRPTQGAFVWTDERDET